MPLLAGDSEIVRRSFTARLIRQDQLFKTFRLLGTPTEETWPGLSELQDWQSAMPAFRGKPLAEAIPGLSADGLDLVQRMLVFDPLARISGASGGIAALTSQPSRRSRTRICRRRRPRR